MNSIPKLLQTSKLSDGRIPFHPLVMQFACRFINKTYEEFMCDYRVLVESNLRCIEAFDHDAVSVISDPFRETSAFGAHITFDGNASPKAEHIISVQEDVDRLIIPDVYECARTLDRIKGVELFRKELGQLFPIIAWVEGPLAESCDLTGVSELLIQMMLEPDMVHQLMNKCLEMAKQFALAQIKAGANIVGVGDAICSQIPPETYEEFVMPLHQELFSFIHQQGALVKLHICGNITHLLSHIAKTGADIVDLDWMVSFVEARQVLGPEVWLCGNTDPVSVIQNGPDDLLIKDIEQIKLLEKDNKWIFSGGCEITPFTSVEKMKLIRKVTYSKLI